MPTLIVVSSTPMSVAISAGASASVVSDASVVSAMASVVSGAAAVVSAAAASVVSAAGASVARGVVVVIPAARDGE